MLTTRSVPTSLVSSLRDLSVMMSDPPIHNRSEIRAETSTGNSMRSSALAGSAFCSALCAAASGRREPVPSTFLRDVGYEMTAQSSDEPSAWDVAM